MPGTIAAFIRPSRRAAFGLALMLLSLTSAVAAFEHRVFAVSCNRCDAVRMQKAAIAAVPGWDGRHPIYLTDNANRTVAKYEVVIDPTTPLQAYPVPIEPEVVAFVADFWAQFDAMSMVIDVPSTIAPSLPDFLGNPAYRGDVYFHIESRIAAAAEFPAEWLIIFSQFLADPEPALPGSRGLRTLRFADGGTVTIEVDLAVNISTRRFTTVGDRVLPGSAVLNGVSIPAERSGFSGYDRAGNEHAGTIEELARLARMWGLEVSCTVATSAARMACDATGQSCRSEVIGSCPHAGGQRGSG